MNRIRVLHLCAEAGGCKTSLNLSNLLLTIPSGASHGYILLCPPACGLEQYGNSLNIATAHSSFCFVMFCDLK